MSTKHGLEELKSISKHTPQKKWPKDEHKASNLGKWKKDGVQDKNQITGKDRLKIEERQKKKLSRLEMPNLR